MNEIEVKILGIDREEIMLKLRNLGARKVKDGLFLIRFFDYPDGRIHAGGGVMRLREEDDKTILVFKGKKKVLRGCKSCEEIELEVGDFEGVSEFLKRIGFECRVDQEKKRVSYEYEGMYFDIDEYPGGVIYMEIEARSCEEVERGISLLRLSEYEKSSETARALFRRLYPEMEFERLKF